MNVQDLESELDALQKAGKVHGWTYAGTTSIEGLVVTKGNIRVEFILADGNLTVDGAAVESLTSALTM